jgi:hypothetical protein
MRHPFCSPKDCPWQGIILRVIYLYTLLDITCPFLPRDVDVTSLIQFRDWLSADPQDYKQFPFHNGLKLFLWLVYDLYNLPQDST